MKRFFKLCLSILLLINFVGCSKVSETELKQIQEGFDDFIQELYIETISSDALSLHFSVTNPSIYDIELEEISLGSLNESELIKVSEELKNDFEELKSYDYKHLSDSQQKEYEVVYDYLSILNESIGYDYYVNLFESSSSLTSNIIVNFTEFKFREIEDIETYLILLADSSRYMDEALEFTKKQVEMGLFMSESSVEETISEIDKFIVKKENNELLISFDNKLAEFDITEQKKAELIKRNEDIVLNSVIPAYERVRDALTMYKSSRKATGGYASIEGGKEYYEFLFKLEVGTTSDIDDYFKQGKEVLSELISSSISLLMDNEELFEQYTNSDDYFETKSPEEILKEYEEMMLVSYPVGPKVSYDIQYLDPSIANSSTIAYYLIPPIDDISENVIKINPDNTNDLKTLYTTLAHEGFPGHCYQRTYFYNLNPHPITTVFDYSGYSEGWAMKTQLDALYWVLEDNKDLATFLNNDTYFLYLIQAMIDVGVNYYDWDKTELKDFLSPYALLYNFTDDSMVDMLYESAINNPGMLLAYGFGMMNMVELENQVKEEMGSKYNAVEYNTLILNLGSLTFDRINEEVENYLDKN